MLISRLLKPSLIKLDVEASSKEELFEEMVDLFVQEGLVPDRELAVDALMERESKMSTGIAPGFALPHGKLEGIKGVLIAIGIVRDGIDFDSLDDEPVYVVLTLFSETGNPVPHIEALAEIGRLLAIPEFTGQLKNARTPEEIIRIIQENEE
ncbi:MAG: PTS sugar transporter subunit IIA [Victivallales bacterium]|nr:PTS sugar transporter subunit IIA [Victivallales bacterium]